MMIFILTTVAIGFALLWWNERQNRQRYLDMIDAMEVLRKKMEGK